MTKLSDISEIIMGLSPKGMSYNNNKNGYPLLNGATDYKGTEFFPNQYTSQPTRLTKKGDVILGIRATIGNFSIVDKEYCIGRGIAAIRVNESIANRDYVKLWIEKRLSQIIHRASGSTIKGIKKEDLTEMLIPLPPLPIQKKIAAILDKAQALCDIEKHIIQKYDQLAQSVFLEMFGDPVRNSKKIRKEKLGNITNLITDGKHGNCRDALDSGYYFISAKDIYNSTINYINARQIMKADFLEVHKRTNLEPGDLLMVNTGATIGKIAIAKEIPETRRTTFQKSIAVIKTQREILDPTFLQFVFNLRINSFASKGSGSAVKNLLLSEIAKFEIILPDIDKQEEFVRKVNIIFEQIDLTKQSLQKSEELFQCLMQKAFKGELLT